MIQVLVEKRTIIIDVINYQKDTKKIDYLPLEREQKMATKTTFIADIDRIDYAESMTNEEL